MSSAKWRLFCLGLNVLLDTLPEETSRVLVHKTQKNSEDEYTPGSPMLVAH